MSAALSSDASSHLAFLRDPLLSAHATSAAPAWLWSMDASRILWANAVGAAIFDEPSSLALTARRFDPRDPVAGQIARLTSSLPAGSAPRLERLRGFGAGLWRTLLCACSHVALPGATAGILVVAMEPAGAALSLAERVKRLYAGCSEPIAVFSAAGTLLHATEPIRQRLAKTLTLIDLAGQAFATEAMASGSASGLSVLGDVVVERIGSETGAVLVASFPGKDRSGTKAGAPDEADLPSAEALRSRAANGAKPTQAAPAEPPALRSEQNRSPLRIDVPIPERRHPLRFVWQMDADGRFTLGSDEFTEVIGPATAITFGRTWDDLAAALALDPEGQVARAVATRDTWSGLTVSWPVDGSAERLKVELSGLPIFDRNRNFIGYRGFGVCRDIDRIQSLTHMRRSAVLTSLQSAAAAAGLPGATADAVPAADQPEPATAENVVPFRSAAAAAEAKTSGLSPVERSAFRELALQLSARLKGAEGKKSGIGEAVEPTPAAQATGTENIIAAGPQILAEQPMVDQEIAERPLLDRLPIGVLVYRLDELLYANRAFLDWTGYADLDDLAEAGGLDSLFVETRGDLGGAGGSEKSFSITTQRGDQLPVEGRLFSVPWNGESALVLMLMNAGRLPAEVLPTADAELRELRAILDAATDGIVVLDRDGRILAANRSAEVLFGYGMNELAGTVFDLLAPQNRSLALDYVAAVSRGTAAGERSEGREVSGRTRRGGEISLLMTIGRVGDDNEKLCAIFRDITPWKTAERELMAAKGQAEKASAAKSDFLAKISHEIRTPLNSIIGFSEVMLEERFGPIGNERYREYLKDICASGGHVVSLLNDLLDLSKIEAGKLELTLTSVNLNELVQSCVASMQPQANRERILIRTSLLPGVRPVTADARAVRQIILNLLSNSIKFTGVGGQVIISTAQAGDGEVTLRVRDTGVGMSEKDLAAALEPFRQLATTSRWGSSGTGLGLPLTKALAEANRATFTISSKVSDGTLVEIVFPPSPTPAG